MPAKKTWAPTNYPREVIRQRLKETQIQHVSYPASRLSFGRLHGFVIRTAPEDPSLDYNSRRQVIISSAKGHGGTFIMITGLPISSESLADVLHGTLSQAQDAI